MATHPSLLPLAEKLSLIAGIDLELTWRGDYAYTLSVDEADARKQLDKVAGYLKDGSPAQFHYAGLSEYDAECDQTVLYFYIRP